MGTNFFLIFITICSLAKTGDTNQNGCSTKVGKAWDLPYESRTVGLGKPCRVTEKKSNARNTDCIFPFKYADKIYYGCSTADNDDKPWCSTNVTAFKEHIIGQGYWGNCPAKCQVQTENLVANITAIQDTEGLFLASSLDVIFDPKEQEQQLFESECAAEVKEFIKTGKTTERLEMCTLNEFELKPKYEEDVGPVECKCVPYKECEWSKKVFQQVLYQNVLTNQQHKTTKLQRQLILATARSFALKRKCSKRYSVLCCNEKPGSKNFFDYPTTKQIETPCVKETSPPPYVNPHDNGSWIPDGFINECGIPTIASNFLSGNIPENGEFPFLALLQYDDGKFKCSGSLINKRYVLTAAHCISKNPRKVILGEYDLSENPDCQTRKGIKLCSPPKMVRNIEKTIVHESYSTDPTNDIALIRLDEVVTLHSEDASTSNILPLCLPLPEEEYEYDYDRKKRSPEEDDLYIDEQKFIKNGYVEGWGKVTNLKEKKGRSIFKIRKEKVTITAENCPNTVHEENQFCASVVPPRRRKNKGKDKKKRDTCVGDSGGPLIARERSDESWKQYAIRSNVQGDACSKSPVGVYTKVAPFLDWIESKLED